MSINKLRWKCRKGIRELDILLETFLQSEFDSLSQTNKIIFEELLDLDTYDLLNAIFGKAQYDDKYTLIIEKLSKLTSKNKYE